ncbi:MAG: ATPase [Bacteroidetes bacterium]|nr:MAG: ATPase [Bacteroidota bacterium]
MAKYKYTTEFEFSTPLKTLFHYITPEGLDGWFAEKVDRIDDKHYDIFWDGVGHLARIAAYRHNNYVKYQFTNEKDGRNNYSFIDFRLNKNEMTGTVFLKIVDYSDMNNKEQLDDLWKSLTGTLRGQIGLE